MAFSHSVSVPETRGGADQAQLPLKSRTAIAYGARCPRFVRFLALTWAILYLGLSTV